MILFIIISKLFLITTVLATIERKFIIVIQDEQNPIILPEEFYEVFLFSGHLNPNQLLENPLAKTRTQGALGIALLNTGQLQQNDKFTICAQKIGRIRTNAGDSQLITFAPLGNFNILQNCAFFFVANGVQILHLFYGVNYTAHRRPPIVQILPSYKLTFNIQIADTEYNNGISYLFHLTCVGRELNNFYFETKVGEKCTQISLLDNICTSNSYWMHVVTAKLAPYPFTSLIMKENSRSTKCSQPKPSVQREIVYDLFYDNNNLQFLCYQPNQIDLETKPNVNIIESSEPGPSVRREVEQPKDLKTLNLLGNFVGQPEENVSPKVLKTENLLANVVGDYQQNNAVTIEEAESDQQTTDQTVDFLSRH
uniref:Uncharacterized protein n=1 Tax=Globodera rostochiensis TaxID=31243 RepID=A0A914H507_GLORO